MSITNHDDLQRWVMNITSDEMRDKAKNLYEQITSENPIPPLWTIREKLRMEAGYYKPVKWDKPEHTKMWLRLRHTNRHPHLPLNNLGPKLIAFTQEGDKGIRDIQSVARIGKYMTMCNSTPTRLTANEINELANAFAQGREHNVVEKSPLNFTQDAGELLDLYRNSSTDTCMTHCASHWKLRFLQMAGTEAGRDPDVQERVDAWMEYKADRHNAYVHPSAFYALSPELAVAYYTKEGSDRLQARAVVNIKHKRYSRVYGNEYMDTLLEREGYTKEGLHPYRVAIAMCSSPKQLTDDIVLLAPYIDGEDHTVNVNMDKGVFISRGDEEPARGTILTLRDYQNGGIAIPEQAMEKNICTCCGALSSASGINPRLFLHRTRREVKLCVTCMYDPDSPYATGLLFSTDGLGLRIEPVTDDKDKFIFLGGRNHLPVAPRFRRSEPMNAFSSSSAAQRQKTQDSVHIDGLSYLSYSLASDCIGATFDVKEVLTPEGTVVDDFGNFPLFKHPKYPNVHVYHERRAEYIGDLAWEITSGNIAYPAGPRVSAICDRTGGTRIRAARNCYYSMAQNVWVHERLWGKIDVTRISPVFSPDYFKDMPREALYAKEVFHSIRLKPPLDFTTEIKAKWGIFEPVEPEEEHTVELTIPGITSATTT